MRKTIVMLSLLIFGGQIFLSQAFFYPPGFAKWRVTRALERVYAERGHECMERDIRHFGAEVPFSPLWRYREIFFTGQSRSVTWSFTSSSCDRFDFAYILPSGRILMGDRMEMFSPMSSLDELYFGDPDKRRGDVE